MPIKREWKYYVMITHTVYLSGPGVKHGSDHHLLAILGGKTERNGVKYYAEKRV